jgi:hypothetical protein
MPHRRWLAWVCVAALVHALVTLAISLTRLYTLKVAVVDLGSVDQAVWTALHYGAPTTTVYRPFEVASWLGYLFTPVVLVLVPVYAVAAGVEWLLVLHSFSIAAAAIPVFPGLSRAAGTATAGLRLGASLSPQSLRREWRRLGVSREERGRARCRNRLFESRATAALAVSRGHDRAAVLPGALRHRGRRLRPAVAASPRS